MMPVRPANRLAAEASQPVFRLLTPPKQQKQFPALLVGDVMLLPGKESGRGLNIIHPPQALRLLQRGVVVPLEPRYTDPAAAYKDEATGQCYQLPCLLKLKSRVATSVLTPAVYSPYVMYHYRDFRCFYSGEVLSDDTISVDHIIPRSAYKARGTNVIAGTKMNSWENCVPAHRDINSMRGDMPYRAFVKKYGYADTLGPRAHQPLVIEVMLQQINAHLAQAHPAWLAYVQDALIGIMSQADEQEHVTSGRLERRLREGLRDISQQQRSMPAEPALAA